LAEDDPAADFLRDPDDPILRGVNHPRMTAIYPPLMLGLFALLSTLAYSPLAVKLAIIGFDLVALGLLLRLLLRRLLDLRWALLYAVNPVVLYAFAGQGHLDAVQCLLLLAVLQCYDRRRWGWMFLLAGLAVQVKYVAILGWPFLVSKENWKQAWIAPAAALLPLVPFLARDGGAVFRSLLEFGYGFAVNGPLHAALRALSGSLLLATTVCQLLLVIALIVGYVWLHPRRSGSPYVDPVAGYLFTFGALLLLSPTVHFWYLAWVVPFLALRPLASWILLCGTVGFALVTGGYEPLGAPWQFPAWALLAVWTLPLLLMLRELRLALDRLRGGMRWEEPHHVSAVVPVLDEERRIAGCVKALRADPAVHEVIVVDGGSRDATAERARCSGARVVEHCAPPDAGGGRGAQILVGCRQAAGDLIAVVHADTRISPGGLTRARARLAYHPDIVGGALGSVFDAVGWRFRLLETANDARAVFAGISFGDQVQFFRRDPVITRNLAPDLPLMEDVELSLRLHKLGRSTYLWDSSVVSARAWRRDACRRSWRVFALTAEYLVRRTFGRADTAGMYRRYYKERPSQ
jgi:GT2 family glycosyltransferase